MSFHEQFERDELPPGSSERALGIVFAVVLACVAAWRGWHGRLDAIGWLLGAAAFLGMAFFWRAPLRPLNRVWLRLGLFLHAVISPVATMLIYALAIVPVGLALRALGKDPLRLKREPDAASYWIPRAPRSGLSRGMKDQF